MSAEIIVAILSSSVLSAFATSYFTKKRVDKTERLKYITEERQKWRDDIRNETIKLISEPTKSKIQESRVYFAIRLNPYDNEDNKLLAQLSESDIKLENFTNAVSILLKHDWERVKYETINKIKPYQFVMILLGLTLFIHQFYDQIYSLIPKEYYYLFESFINKKMFWFMLSIILIPYIFRIFERLLKAIFSKNLKSLNNFKEFLFHVLDLPYRRPL